MPEISDLKNRLRQAQNGSPEQLYTLIQGLNEAERRKAYIIAVPNNHLDVVTNLIEVGVNINQDIYGKTLLMIAVMNGMTDIVEFLLNKGADKEKQDKNGNTALMHAVMSCSADSSADIVRLLIKAGADKEKQNGDGNTALMMAVMNSNLSMVSMLLAERVDKEKQDKKGKTALMMAAQVGCADIILLLLNKGADKEKQDKNGNTALMFAVVYGHANILKLLIKAGARIGVVNKLKWTPLEAITKSQPNVVVEVLTVDASMRLPSVSLPVRDAIVGELIKYGVVSVYEKRAVKKAWEVARYQQYFTKENLLAIFQEAIREGEVKVLLNLYSEPVYRDTLLQADENTQAKFKDVYNFLNEYGFPPKEPVLKAAQAIKFQRLIFAKGINAILLHFTGKTIRLDAANSHLKMILKTVFASAQGILPIILEYADWQDQWYNARQIIEEYLKVCEPKIKIIAGADLNALQESFGFDEIIKQEISARFVAARDNALLIPSFQGLWDRDQNKARLFVQLKLIAQTLSYDIIFSSDGNKVRFSVQNPTHSYKFYYHSQEQLMLLQEIAHSPQRDTMEIANPGYVTTVYRAITEPEYSILNVLTPDVIELIGKENFSKILQMPEWMSEEFAKRVKEKGVLKAVEEITNNNNNAEQHSVEEAISQAYAFNTGEDIKPIIQDYYSKLLPKFGDMSQFEADMLLLGTLADKTQQNIVLRSVDNITGTVYHQLIGNAENQQAPIFIDVNENGYFSKKDFSYLLGPKPETLHVDDSLKPLEIMPETDYFSSFASLSALFVFMFYYSDGLQ